MCYPNPEGLTMQSKYQEITFTDGDVLNKEDWIPQGEYNPHNVHPWLFHDHGFVLCVVFAGNLQDALDIAADADKLDRYLVDAKDYPEDDPAWEDFAYLGNASEPFDIESLQFLELPNPPFSFCAVFNLRPGI